MTSLADRDFVRWRDGIDALTPVQQDELLELLPEGWIVVDGHHLARDFRFRNFEHALGFVNKVGGLADSLDHHPDLHLSYGRVVFEVWTHRIDALTESDFVFAAKSERFYGESRK